MEILTFPLTSFSFNFKSYFNIAGNIFASISISDEKRSSGRKRSSFFKTDLKVSKNLVLLPSFSPFYYLISTNTFYLLEVLDFDLKLEDQLKR